MRLVFQIANITVIVHKARGSLEVEIEKKGKLITAFCCDCTVAAIYFELTKRKNPVGAPFSRGDMSRYDKTREVISTKETKT